MLGYENRGDKTIICKVKYITLNKFMIDLLIWSYEVTVKRNKDDNSNWNIFYFTHIISLYVIAN